MKNKQNIKEEMRHNWEEVEMDIDKDCTCNNCVAKNNCVFAFDLYNINGDCLVVK